MECQILFSGENETDIIYLSSAAFIQRVLEVKLIDSSAVQLDVLTQVEKRQYDCSIGQYCSEYFVFCKGKP